MVSAALSHLYIEDTAVYLDKPPDADVVAIDTAWRSLTHATVMIRDDALAGLYVLVCAEISRQC